MQLYLKNWYSKLLQELPNTKNLRIISPFVKEQVLRKIEDRFDFNDFELITRFKLKDFAMNVSSLNGLKFCLEKKASVFGVKNLHSKVYLFDNRAAIVTSANLTNGGLSSNYECGIYVTDKKVITDLHLYFESLKNIAGKKLELENCIEWEEKLLGVRIPSGEKLQLGDFGGVPDSSFDINRNYYIKFLGSSNDRVDLKYPIRTEIDRALCHYACGFPKNKRPRQVNEGDIIFLARMTKNPADYAVFGKAVALKFVDGRDVASQMEISERPWKEHWPNYLRVRNPVFVDGILGDGILVSDLLSEFEYNSFPSTRKRFDEGEIDINPTKSLMQKAYIKLTHDSAEWLDNKLNGALENFGQVPNSFLNSLPQTTTNILDWDE